VSRAGWSSCEGGVAVRGTALARDVVRLAIGTLTVVPVRPPARVDREVAGWAMALAPLVGAALGLLAAAAVWALSGLLEPLPAAVLVVGVLALSSRLVHWDGLADTADGLGSGRPAEEALEVMRRSDTGPFGVFAVLLVFAAQATALASLAGSGAPGAALAAVALGRGALPVGCRSGVPSARPQGLGTVVAGSVGVPQAVTGAGVVAVVVLACAVSGLLTWPQAVVGALASAGWAFAATAYLRRRLGGMTGDTLGALVETTTAVALVALAAG
jgi:adenosylcobinamide-GDP ribazoletransferase